MLHLEPDEVELLDDKAAFARTAADLGLPVPETHEVHGAADVPLRAVRAQVAAAAAVPGAGKSPEVLLLLLGGPWSFRKLKVILP